MCLAAPEGTINMVEFGPNKFQLEISNSLEARRQEFTEDLRLGYRIISEFAADQGWAAHMKNSYVEKAWIFDKKSDYDKLMIELTDAPKDTKLPSSFTAGLEKNNYIVVSPELIAELVPKLVEKEFFAKLFAHEIAHRLHIRILHGNEEAMGPIWFFEGFAV